MRKLDIVEEHALFVLKRHGGYCPGSDRSWTPDSETFVRTLDQLVKKKRVRVEMTDDGPRYEPTDA